MCVGSVLIAGRKKSPFIYDLKNIPSTDSFEIRLVLLNYVNPASTIKTALRSFFFFTLIVSVYLGGTSLS